MEIVFEENPVYNRIRLNGRMDIEGTEQIEMKLTSLTATSDGAHIILDLAGVEYLASIGLGLLIRTAQAVQRRKGSVVILDPQPIVASVLASSAIDKLIPVVHGEAAAAVRFSGGASL